MLKRNLDNSGRLWRLCIAILLLLYAGWAGSWIALLISAFCFFEAFRGWCLFFQLMGKNSCPIDRDKK